MVKKLFDAAVYAFGAKTADERDNIRRICRETFCEGDNKLSFLFCLVLTRGTIYCSFRGICEGKRGRKLRIKGQYIIPLMKRNAYKRVILLSLSLRRFCVVCV